MLEKKSAIPFIFCILLQSIVYGLGNPLTKVGFESITALWCLAVRFVGAALIMFLLFGPRVINQLRQAKLTGWLLPSLCMAFAYLSCNLALLYTTATNVGFLMSLPVVFAPFLAVLVLKRKYPWRSVPIQLTVVGGLYLLCCGGASGSFIFGLGEALALLCALFVAGALVFSEKCLAQLDPISMSAVQTGVTAVICLAAALLFDDPAALTQVKTSAWLIVAYLALTCTCLAYVLQNTALTGISAEGVSMLQCTQPVMTALFSFLILQEKLSLLGLLGAAIIMICVVVENYLNYRDTKLQAESAYITSGQSAVPDE